MSEKCRHCQKALSSTYRGLAEGLNSCALCAANFDFSDLDKSAQQRAGYSVDSHVPHLSAVVQAESSEANEGLPLADIEEIEIENAQSTIAQYDAKRALRLLLAERKLLKRKVMRLTEDNEALETELTRIQHGTAKLEQELMQTRELAARLRAKKAKAGLLERQELRAAVQTDTPKVVTGGKPAKRGQASFEMRSGGGLHAGGNLPYANSLLQKRQGGQQGSVDNDAVQSNCARFSERESQLGQNAQRAEHSSRSRAFINGGRE